MQLEKTYGGDDRFKITGGGWGSVDLKLAEKSEKFDISKMERDNLNYKKEEKARPDFIAEEGLEWDHGLRQLA